MSLKVYAGKNQASRRYELSFFRAFANTLAGQFKEQGRDGVLLGHPRSLDNEYFQPDALLITRNVVIVIDFKNFDNVTIRLPNEDGFSRLEWKSVSDSGESVVKGGASPNPFAQLQKQSRWMNGVLDSAGVDLAIQTCVLFQGDIQLEGNVPGKYQAFFSIATGFDYPNVLNDSINVGSPRTLADFETLVARFEVTEYKDYVAISPDNLIVAASLAEASQRKQEAADTQRLAELRLTEAEARYVHAESQGKSLSEAKIRLDNAISVAERATAVALETQQKFDEKRHELELSRELTEQKRADAATQQSRTRGSLFRLVALLVVGVIVVAGVVFFSSYQAEEANRLQEDRVAGRVCIPAATAAEFVGQNDVCVTFTVRHIGESETYVFVQEQYRGEFTALIMDKSIFSKQEATDSFMDKTVEVRGDIREYGGKPEIEVFKSSQIVVLN